MLSLDNALNNVQLTNWLRRVVKAATELKQETDDVGKEYDNDPDIGLEVS